MVDAICWKPFNYGYLCATLFNMGVWAMGLVWGWEFPFVRKQIQSLYLSKVVEHSIRAGGGFILRGRNLVTRRTRQPEPSTGRTIKTNTHWNSINTRSSDKFAIVGHTPYRPSRTVPVDIPIPPRIKRHPPACI